MHQTPGLRGPLAQLTFTLQGPPLSSPSMEGAGLTVAAFNCTAATPAAFSPSLEELHSDGFPHLSVLLKLPYTHRKQGVGSRLYDNPQMYMLRLF